ncbi:hypothetical protein RB201_30100 [Streptomyces sp. S1A(2023)]
MSVGKQLQEFAQAGAQAFLVEWGLLPNYSLVEDGVRLEAALTRKEPPRRARGSAATDKPPASQWRTETRTYTRPSESALTELAPGNSYYVLGYHHKIDGFDLGPRPKGDEEDPRSAVVAWRVCRECGHVRTKNAEADTSPCPRCAGPGIGGRAALHHVIVPHKVTSRDKRDDARIIDDHDSRNQRYYSTATAVDIDPAAIKESWRHSGATFGVDHVREAFIRRFNLGPARLSRRPEHVFRRHRGHHHALRALSAVRRRDRSRARTRPRTGGALRIPRITARVGPPPPVVSHAAPWPGRAGPGPTGDHRHRAPHRGAAHPAARRDPACAGAAGLVLRSPAPGARVALRR